VEEVIKGDKIGPAQDAEVMNDLAANEVSAETLTAWRSAALSAEFEDGAVVHPQRIAAHFACPVYLLTAWNPGAVQRDVASNEEASLRLKADLHLRGASHIYPGVGSDSSSSPSPWEEHGFVVVGLDRKVIKELGLQYGQVAVYEFEGSKTRIVWCVGNVVVEI